MHKTIGIKILLAVLFLTVASSASSFAQIKDGLNFEVGGGYHFSKAFGVSGDLGRTAGPGAYLEIRDCMGCLDYGGQLTYKYSTGSGYESNTGPLLDQTCHLALLKAIADYNFCPESIANPYLGLGLGTGYLHLVRSDNLLSRTFTFAICARAGVQISIVRLTFDYDIYGTSFRSRSGRTVLKDKLGHTLSMTLGLAF